MLGLGPSRRPFPGGQDGTGAQASHWAPSDRGQERGHPISCSLWRRGLGHHMPTTGHCTPPTIPRASSAGALAASSCGPHQRPAAGRGFWQKCRIPADLRRMHTNSPSPLRPKHQADIRRDSSPASTFPESLNCSWETNAEMQVIPLLTNTQSKPAGSFPFLLSLRLLTHSARPSTPPATQEHPPPRPRLLQTPVHCAATCPSSTNHHGTGPLEGTGLPPNKR